MPQKEPYIQTGVYVLNSQKQKLLSLFSREENLSSVTRRLWEEEIAKRENQF